MSASNCHWYFSTAVLALPLHNSYTKYISAFSSVANVKGIIVSTKCIHQLCHRYGVTEPVWTNEHYVTLMYSAVNLLKMACA